MTNFEFIAKDESTLANWLCDRMDCHMCPVWGECFYNDDKPRTQFVYEWLKSEAKAKKKVKRKRTGGSHGVTEHERSADDA